MKSAETLVVDGKTKGRGTLKSLLPVEIHSALLMVIFYLSLAIFEGGAGQ